MTPVQLYAALDERRRELGWPWWRIEIAVPISAKARQAMARGQACLPVRTRSHRWLRLGPRRRRGQPRKEQ